MQTYAPNPAKGRIALVALALWAAVPILFGPKLFGQATDIEGALPQSAASDQKGYAFSSAEEGFSATFPSEPKRSEDPDATSPEVIYQSTVGRGSMGVVISDWPEDVNGKAGMESLRAYVDSSVRGKLVSSREASVRGNPAIDLVLESEEGRLLGRVLLVGSVKPRLYFFQTTTDPSPDLKAAYERLLSSFELTD